MSHIHLYAEQIKKTIYHVVNIITMEAELFTIRYGIN